MLISPSPLDGVRPLRDAPRHYYACFLAALSAPFVFIRACFETPSPAQSSSPRCSDLRHAPAASRRGHHATASSADGDAFSPFLPQQRL
jgi:hypothetical protein